MTRDKNFDDKAEWFQQRIYGGMKGQLRLYGLWQDLTRHVSPLLENTGLNVWDAGGGLGQMSLRCAELGHSVLLNDVSAEMLAQAQQSIEKNPDISSRITMANKSIQQCAAEDSAHYDVIICHAVLEWLQDAETVVNQLCEKLKPGGYLSLAFYNVNSAVFMNVLKGNFKKALSGDFSGHPGGLTPPSPQHPEAVLGWLQSQQLDIVAKSGVRVAFDYMPRNIREQRSEDDIVAVENLLRQQPGFWALGRYVHLIAKKP